MGAAARWTPSRCRTGRAALGAGAGGSLRHAPATGRARPDPRRRRNLGRARRHAASARNGRGALGATTHRQRSLGLCSGQHHTCREPTRWGSVGRQAQKPASHDLARPLDTYSTCAHRSCEALDQRRRADLSTRCRRMGRPCPAPAPSRRAFTTPSGSGARFAGWSGSRRASCRRSTTRREADVQVTAGGGCHLEILLLKSLSWTSNTHKEGAYEAPTHRCAMRVTRYARE